MHHPRECRQRRARRHRALEVPRTLAPPKAGPASPPGPTSTPVAIASASRTVVAPIARNMSPLITSTDAGTSCGASGRRVAITSICSATASTPLCEVELPDVCAWAFAMSWSLIADANRIAKIDVSTRIISFKKVTPYSLCVSFHRHPHDRDPRHRSRRRGSARYNIRRGASGKIPCCNRHSISCTHSRSRSCKPSRPESSRV